MIELPKYTVPTYNQRSAIPNERTDYTRRIPTGLSDKQLDRDRKIAMQLVKAFDTEDDMRVINLFRSKAHLLSNPRYWELMRSVWIGCGSTETSEIFRRLMRSGRPCRSWFMTPEDAKALDAMDFPVTVYRAYGNVDDPGISWTLDKAWCEDYAKRKSRKVKSRQVSRNEIFAYVTRRGEEEIIIL